jgi:uncharacterized coiled-coil protein SlyX
MSIALEVRVQKLEKQAALLEKTLTHVLELLSEAKIVHHRNVKPPPVPSGLTLETDQ